VKTNPLNISKIFKSERKQKILVIIESFSLSEKITFYFAVIVFAGSALYLLVKVNDAFSVQVPVDGGEIREGVIGYPRYINPLISVTDTGKDLSGLIYSGLLKNNDEGKLVPDLAKDYKISEDGQTYTVNLKDNIFFHDGVPVTTYDIEFTVKKAVDPILKSPKAANWEGVSVKVISPKTIEFVLKAPYSPFLQNLTLGILPKHIWEKIDSDAFVFSNFDLEPTGSGPFMIKNVKRDGTGLPIYYHLVPFAKYALGKPHIDDLYVYFYTNEDSLISAFIKGEVTNINSISPANINKIEKDKIVAQVPLPRTFALFLNQNQARVLANKEVRDALNLAIDRDSIVDEVLSGYGTKLIGPLGPNISKLRDTDMKAEDRVSGAIKILQNAGWVLGDDGVMNKVVKKETQTLTFAITTSNSPDLKKTALILQKTWAKIGAKVDVKIFDLADLQQNAIKNRKYDSLLFGIVIDRDLDIFSFWHSSERNSPGLNISMYTNANVDKLLEKIRLENDTEKKLGLLKSVEDNIVSDSPAIFLYAPDFIYVVPKNLRGLSLGNLTSSSERFAGIEKWYIKTEKVWQIFKSN